MNFRGFSFNEYKGKGENMDLFIETSLVDLSTFILFFIIAISLYLLSLGANMLVDESVKISSRLGISEIIVGATIVSLGTTLPETTVSVMAALNGNPDLALGNAIGSIITNTGLIIGIAALIGELAIDRKMINRQGGLLLILGFLLAIFTLPVFSRGPEGRVSQWMGFVFIGFLVFYIFMSIYLSKKVRIEEPIQIEEGARHIIFNFLKLILAIATIIFSSRILIPSVELAAVRIGIPQSVIGATLLAFGTSLPELVTAITAVKKGHGQLTIGNIIGANILNILFVIGAASAVSSGGLLVSTNFYKLQIPTMLIILVLFYLLAKTKEDHITRKEGLVLLAIYFIYLLLNYILPMN